MNQKSHTSTTIKQQQLDEHFMLQAIALAKKGTYTTSPNPAVGCVLVKDSKIIGQGWHQRAGQGHAEVNALLDAGKESVGATAYVTLEPCSHFGRTPPCAKGLIEAGITRVVVAMQDPNPLVSGRGIAMLEQAGISCTVLVLENAAKQLNPGFIHRMVKNKPLVRCKMAASLDGKTAMASGESKWITGSAARQDVQNYRAMSCAIISGADTVLVDDAKLNVRFNELSNIIDCADFGFDQQTIRQPIRVIIDTQNRLHPKLALFQSTSDIILVRTKLENDHAWPHFVTQLVVKSRNTENGDKADLNDLLTQLALKNINSVWLEAGKTLSGAFIGAGLVDELILYQAPKLMGNNSLGLFDIEQLNKI